MVRFNFIVDKQACFVYWAQSLIRWGWYFEEKEADFYKKQAEPFSKEEARALERLRVILEKDGNGFLWLWKRYQGETIKNHSEREEWEEIKRKLTGKFEAVWNREHPLLESWQKKLSAFPTKRMEEFLSRVSLFLAVEEKRRNIDVKLCFHWDRALATGHTKKEFPTLIILNLSNVETGNLKNVIAVLVHEAVHILENSSQVEKLLKTSYARIIEPRRFKLDGPKWKYLFTESLITAIADRRGFSVAFNFLFGDSEKSDEEGFNVDVVRNKTNYGFQIREVAYRLRRIVARYFDERKEIDEHLCDAVAREWLEIARKYQFEKLEI